MKKMSKKRKVFVLSLVLLLLLVLFLQSSLARYIYHSIHNFILESQGFYFSSSILKKEGASYSINNWDGVNDYSLTIDVNSKKNDLVWTKSDIQYQINVICPEYVECSTNKTNGIIYQTTKADSFIVNIHPKQTMRDGENIEVKVEATSTFPYQKKLSATYQIGVETMNFSYQITDHVGDKYFTLELTNSISYYEVHTAFGSYQVGDHLSVEEYLNLSEEQRKNCFSAKVRLTIPSHLVSLDMTNKSYKNMIPGSLETTSIDGNSYVSSYSFYIDASSSEKVLFYKKDTSKDYSFTGIGSSIIGVDVVTASF